MESGRVWAVNLRNVLLQCELDKLQPLLNTLFKRASRMKYGKRKNEHYYHALIHLTFRLLGIYVESQVQTSDGRLDALVQIKAYVYAFEFKLTQGHPGDTAAQEALQQIKDKGYLLPYQHQGKICIGIGVNFSKEHKKVQEIVWEEII